MHAADDREPNITCIVGEPGVSDHHPRCVIFPRAGDGGLPESATVRLNTGC
jgi:hypothetical protein